MKKLIIISVLLLAAVLITGCNLLQKLGFTKSEPENNDEIFPVSSIILSEEEVIKLSDKMQIHLYFSNSDNSKLMKEIRYIPIKNGKDTVTLASEIVRELIKGPSKGTGFKSTVPQGVKLRSPVSIEAGVATVDFTKEFIDNHPGGQSEETITIFSIVNSLTELKDIHKVMFTIEGKTREEFKGAFRFNAPFPRNTALICHESSITSFSNIGQESENNTSDNQLNNDSSEETVVPVEENLDEPYIEILE
jgi:germination protein M